MLSFLMAIAEFFRALWSADKFLFKDSPPGESRTERESRGVSVTCGLICLILLLIAAAVGLAWHWWS